MKNYIINKSKDNHNCNEVHTSTCYRAQNIKEYEKLGIFNNENEAVAYAKKHGYPNADGCFYCCPNAHTK